MDTWFKSIKEKICAKYFLLCQKLKLRLAFCGVPITSVLLAIQGPSLSGGLLLMSARNLLPYTPKVKATSCFETSICARWDITS